MRINSDENCCCVGHSEGEVCIISSQSAVGPWSMENGLLVV